MPVSKPAADFATATGDYFVTITAGNKGRKRPILDRPSVATLAADTAMTYDSGMVSAGDVVLGGSYRYEVCDAGATDHHLTTAAGVKLKALPRDGAWSVLAFGAPSDGMTDDAPYIQAAVDAAEDHGTVLLPPAVTMLSPVTMPTDRNIRVLGAPTRVKHGAVECFRTLDAPSNDTARHIFDGISFEAITNYTGTCFYIENAGGQAYRNIKAFSPRKMFDLHNNAAGSFSEGNFFENVEARGFVYGWHYRKTSGNASFSDQHFLRCKVAMVAATPPGEPSFGIYVAAGCSLYRSFFGNLTVFPQTEDAVGLYIDGNIKNASGAINIEGDTGINSSGVVVGPNCAGSQHFVVFDIRSVDTSFSQDAASITDFLVRSSQAGGDSNGCWVNEKATTIIESYTRPDDNQKLLRKQVKTNDRVETATSQPQEFFDLSGNLQSLKSIPFGDNGTATTGASVETRNLTRITMNYAGAETVSALANGLIDQGLTLIFSTGNVTLAHSSALRLKDAVSYTPPAGEVMRFICEGAGNWRELSRLLNPPRGYTATAIGSAANAVNTASKYAGKLIRDTTNNRLMMARGPAAADPWDVIDGSASVTPA